MESIKWTPQEAFNQTQASPLLRDPSEGKNSTCSSRTLRLLDTTSAAWYILTIIGIYGLIFVFQLASNILRRNERSLEDVYYSNLTSELKRKGFQSKAAQCSSLIVSSAAAARPQQLGLEPKCEDSRLHVETQLVPGGSRPPHQYGEAAGGLQVLKPHAPDQLQTPSTPKATSKLS